MSATAGSRRTDPRVLTSSPSTTNWTRITAKGLALAARNVSYVLVAVLALLWTLLVVRWAMDTDVIGFDFEGTLWEPGVAIREGRSPYPAPTLAEVDVGNPAVYPPLLMVVLAPLTLLPWSLGVTVWTALLATAVAGSLYILNVRDARCYLFAIASPLVSHGLVLGNATLLLVPLVALAWRWRNHWLRSGALVGLAIASKLLLWPLLFWLLGTRRYRAFAAALAAASAGVLVPWAVIGFDGISSYPKLLGMAEEVYAAHSFSIATWFSGLGVETELGSRVGLGVGLAIASGALYAGRRGADSTSVSFAVLAAILASPIVWPFYYALLLIPLAIARPRFSGLWVVLTLFFVADRLPRDHLYASELRPGEPPPGVPLSLWLFNHADPGLWPAAGYAVVGAALVAVSAMTMLRSSRTES